MASISIIGNGNMGQAIAGIASKGGNTVQLLGSQDGSTTITGEIIILAVPYPAIAGIIEERGAQLADKIIVDISNPLNFETFDSLTVPADSSATAVIAAALPNARVLKAFNTTFAATLASGKVGENITTVLVAGDELEAKTELAGIISAGGLRAIDAGALSRARELEGIGFLQISLAASEKISWSGGFAIV